MKHWHGLLIVAAGILVAIVLEPFIAKMANPLLSPLKLNL